MTTLQKGICLACVLIAGAAAVMAGVFLAPPPEEVATSENAAQTVAASAPTRPEPVSGGTSTQPSAPRQGEATPATSTQAQTQPQVPTRGLPPARIEPRVFDFGLKNPNELVWATFKLRNPTQQTLYVREVKPACKCTVPTLDKDVLPPGGEITMRASIDLRGHLGDANKNFHVFFEGYPQPLEGVIKGVLSYPVQVMPDHPQFSSFPRDRVGQLTLRSLESRPFRVCAVNGREPQVLFKNSPGEEATEWRVRYEIEAANPAELPYMLIVETDHPGARMIDIKLTGQSISGRELQWIKLWKEIFVNRTNVNLGVIPKGQYVDFETSVMRPDHSQPCTVSFQSRMFEVATTPLEPQPGELTAEVVKIEPIDGRADEEMYTVRVTNHSDENKLVHMPLYFHSGEVESRTWIGARLIPSPGDDPCSTTGAP